MEGIQTDMQEWLGVLENMTAHGKKEEFLGKVRYMNANGLRRKFKIDRYVDRVNDNLFPDY